VIRLEWTFFQALSDVGQQRFAVNATMIPTAVMTAAVKINHHTDGFKFLFHCPS